MQIFLLNLKSSIICLYIFAKLCKYYEKVKNSGVQKFQMQADIEFIDQLAKRALIQK